MTTLKDNIINKLLNELKNEIHKDENIDMINKEIINPIVEKSIMKLYPYLIFASSIIIFITISIFFILFLNLRIYYS